MTKTYIESLIAIILFEFEHEAEVKESDEGTVIEIRAKSASKEAKRIVLVDKEDDVQVRASIVEAARQLKQEMYGR